MKRTGRFGWIRALILSLAVFALIVSAAIMLLNYIENESDEAQINMVKDAVHNSLITCYAVEGAYPKSIQHLVDNYGLSYDEDRFLITYDAFASNIFPDVHVNVKGVPAE